MGRSIEQHRADVHVGVRVRLLRTRARLSQPRVAQAIGISYQQLQKYETGANRIAAGTLWDLSRVIGCEISDFYEGLAEGDATLGVNPDSDDLAAVLDTPAGATLVRAFPRMTALVQQEIAALAKALIRPDEGSST